MRRKYIPDILPRFFLVMSNVHGFSLHHSTLPWQRHTKTVSHTVPFQPHAHLALVNVQRRRGIHQSLTSASFLHEQLWLVLQSQIASDFRIRRAGTKINRHVSCGSHFWLSHIQNKEGDRGTRRVSWVMLCIFFHSAVACDLWRLEKTWQICLTRFAAKRSRSKPQLQDRSIHVILGLKIVTHLSNPWPYHGPSFNI